MSGPLPSAIFELSCLEQLCLQRNHFSGELPEDLGKLTKLQRLWLDRNQFSGAVPWKAITKLNELEELDLSSNLFEAGELPYSPAFVIAEESAVNESQIVPATGIDAQEQEHSHGVHQDGEQPIQVSGEELVEEVGTVVDLSRLQKLKKLGLASMNLTGSIPPTLGNISSLQRVYLQNNKLSGHIPDSLVRLTSLKQMVLSHNDLSVPLGSGITVNELWCENPAAIACLYRMLWPELRKQ